MTTIMDKSASLAMYQYLVKTGGNFEQERKRAGQEETLVDNLDNNIVNNLENNFDNNL